MKNTGGGGVMVNETCHEACLSRVRRGGGAEGPLPLPIWESVLRSIATKASSSWHSPRFMRDESGCAPPPVTSHQSRHYWHHQRRRMRLVMINDIRRFDHARGAGLLFAGVQVAIEAREIAAGNFQPQLVAGEENIARGPQVHGDVIRLARIRQLRFFLRIAVAQPQNSARQILRKSIRPNVHEHPREVRVYRRAAYVPLAINRSACLG